MNQLSDLQMKLLEMLSYFHEFCEENSFEYYVIGGTMLGTIRHGGFIPWDDDIDIGMPRRFYEKLKSFNELAGGKYIFESVNSTCEDYTLTFTKLYDTTTTLTENSHQHLTRGIYIDIFPLDGLGKTERIAKRRFKAIDLRKNILNLRTIKRSKDRLFYKNFILLLVQKAPSFMINDKKLSQKIDLMCRGIDFTGDIWGGNLLGAWGWREVLPFTIFGTPQLYSFENIQVYGVEKYDEYLTHIYGEWRSLPPIENRVSHHDRIVDLEKSYLS